MSKRRRITDFFSVGVNQEASITSKTSNETVIDSGDSHTDNDHTVKRVCHASQTLVSSDSTRHSRVNGANRHNTACTATGSCPNTDCGPPVNDNVTDTIVTSTSSVLKDTGTKASETKQGRTFQSRWLSYKWLRYNDGFMRCDYCHI